jgi:hypothetical protein
VAHAVAQDEHLELDAAGHGLVDDARALEQDLAGPTPPPEAAQPADELVVGAGQ